jgi:uncharacterized membrane protein YoaT (DUF817 family)
MQNLRLGGQEAWKLLSLRAFQHPSLIAFQLLAIAYFNVFQSNYPLSNLKIKIKDFVNNMYLTEK